MSFRSHRKTRKPKRRVLVSTITNTSGIPLALAVWLLHDEYDYIDEPNYISATGLMRPLRHIILPKRIPPEERIEDVSEYTARALGHALHDSIEKAWIAGKDRCLKLLGYPEQIRNRVLINPTDDEVRAIDNPIPVYCEQRAFRQVTVDGVTFTIGGKFDLVADGIVQDYKSTSVYSWISGGRDDEHRLQGSIYRWLDAYRPRQGHLRRITEDFMQINYIFTDWSKMMAKANPKYPSKRIEGKTLQLLSVEDTEAWIVAKLREYMRYKDSPEDQIPECTDEELWRSDPQFKFFLDPAKANTPGARSTKNFDNLADARTFQVEKGGKGAIKIIPGEPKRCNYCAAFNGCTQKDRLGLGEGPVVLSNDVLDACLV